MEAGKIGQSFLFGVDRNKCLEIRWREIGFNPTLGVARGGENGDGLVSLSTGKYIAVSVPCSWVRSM